MIGKLKWYSNCNLYPMKLNYLKIAFLLVPFVIWSQQEFHVFPKDHKTTAGKTTGNGSVKNPWDLQTALSQQNSAVNGGDTIFLHEGIYNGRFISTLNSTNSKKIVVRPYKTDKVILNGNVDIKNSAVLVVKGKQVIFKNFEITFLGEFPRKQTESGFRRVSGIEHVSGVDCEFINLKIHNNPGSGFGSWKRTGGTIIAGCTIFNNGYFSTKRGSGVGIYVQNESDNIRLIKNNTIFNNYYKGIEVWSDNRNAKNKFVKNITLQNNVVFNSGLPAGHFKDNLIIGTNDNNGLNLAENISVDNNIFYHNTNVSEGQVGGDAASLTLGFNPRAPLKKVSVKNNIIIGRNNAMRFNNATSLTFQNNSVYCGYVHLNKTVLQNIAKWKFNNNTYYTKRNVPFRISKHKDYKLDQWQAAFPIDKQSQWKHVKTFDLDNVLSITSNENNSFRVVLFNREGKAVDVNFSEYRIAEGTPYAIKNIETEEIIVSGKLAASKVIVFPMDSYNQTRSNFGVYSINFEAKKEVKKKKKESFFKRIFGWLF